jgi:hypothetical protein
VAARTFEDSSGAVWEVFEVHRSSSKAGAVSTGLEQGWLAFVSGQTKRRLAPYPPSWETAAVPELERLCALARAAPTPRYVFDEKRPQRQQEAERLPDASPSDVAMESTVRDFAHEARARGLPAIEAMIQLKLLIAERYPDPASGARDMRRLRRWFVEAYYFERNA